VILFQILTGELPFRGHARMLIVQIIRDEPPGPRRLNASIPQDLETICLKCLEKLPGSRYQTAREVAAELRRFLAGQPIEARPIGRLKRGWRWCRRQPAVASLAAAVLFTFVTGIVVSTYFAVNESQQRNAAKKATINALASAQTAAREASYSEESSMLAEEFMDRYANPMSEETLFAFPGFEPFRTDMLKAALNYYEQLLLLRSDDSAFHVQGTIARLRIAIIKMELGESDWLTPLEAGISAMDDKLGAKTGVAKFPVLANGIWRATLGANTKWQLGIARDSVKALRVLSQARDIWVRLVDENPSARGLNNDLAVLHLISGRIIGAKSLTAANECLLHCKRARDIWQQLTNAYPSIPEYTYGLAIATGTIGIFSDGPAALPHLSDACNLMGQLVHRHPGVPIFEEALFFFERARANGYVAVGDAATANRVYVKAIRMHALKLRNSRYFGLYGSLDGAVKKLESEYEPLAKLIAESEVSTENMGRYLYESGRFVDALEHIKFQIRVEPATRTAWTKGDCFAALGQWAEAIAEFAEVAQREPGLALNWYRWAIASQAAGKKDEYDRILEEMYTRFRSDAKSAGHVLYTCLPFAKANMSPKRLAELAARVDANEGNDSHRLHGAALVRGRRYKEGLDSFEKVKVNEDSDQFASLHGSPAWDYFFMAIAHYHLGNGNEAQRNYFEGVKWTKRFESPVSQGIWWQNVESDHLRREAAGILGIENSETQARPEIQAVTQ
jgi:tetratricopeptide (TPR) repeat protein